VQDKSVLMYGFYSASYNQLKPNKISWQYMKH